MLIRTAASLLSPQGRGAKLSILTFHRVLPAPDELLPDDPDANRFDEELNWIGRWFRVLPLDEAVQRLAQGTLPARAAALTFDDGYANNVSVALPILVKHAMPATFFIATEFLGGGRMWNDSVIECVRAVEDDELDLDTLGLGRHRVANGAEKRHTINTLLNKIKYLEPRQRLETVDAMARAARVQVNAALMMHESDVVRLRQAGMQIGAHTCTHPILSRIPDREAVDEISRSKQVLEEILNMPVTLFAYPNGVPDRDYASRHAHMVEAAGFQAAVSTAVGAASSTDDPYQLPRFKPWDRAAWRYGMRMLSNLTVAGARAAA